MVARVLLNKMEGWDEREESSACQYIDDRDGAVSSPSFPPTTMAGAPDWLNRQLVQKALECSSGQSVRINSVNLELMGEAADTCSSSMFRITARTTKGQRVLIAKTMPNNEQMKEAMQLGRTFEREAFMLSEVLPELHQMLRGSKRGAEPPLKSPLAPSCALHGTTPGEFIIMEDLRSKGFRLADRVRGLDWPHALLAVRALALFHAASAVYLQRHPEAVDKLGNSFGLLKDRYIHKVVWDTFPMVSKLCQGWKGFQEIAEYLDKATTTAADDIAVCTSPCDSKLNVICHGDFWLNNMMFKHEAGAVSEIRFVDFQMSYVASPAADLLYFIFSSVSQEVLKWHFNGLLQEYHRVLVNVLSTGSLKPPSLEELREELKRNGIVGVFATAVILPIAKSKTYPELELPSEEKDYKSSFLYTQTVQDWLQIGLSTLSEWSIFISEQEMK